MKGLKARPQTGVVCEESCNASPVPLHTPVSPGTRPTKAGRCRSALAVDDKSDGQEDPSYGFPRTVSGIQFVQSWHGLVGI
jgi:hypothetical protein